METQKEYNLRLQLEVAREAIANYKLVCQNQQAHIVRLLEQLNPEHPVFGHKHDSWFDQTVGM
jgi:hypothetical protein